MTGDVIQLDDCRPHLCITGADGGAYVLPVQLVVDVSLGRTSPEALGVPCLRTIVREWLNAIQGGNP